MQAGFSFRDKGEAFATLIGVRNETRRNSSFAHESLLATFPPVRMGQNIFSARLEASPQVNAICMRLFDVFMCAFMKVTQEVCKNVDGRFTKR